MSKELTKIYSTNKIPEFNILIYVHNNILTQQAEDINDILSKLNVSFKINNKNKIGNSKICVKTKNDYMLFKLSFQDPIQKAYILTPIEELENDTRDYYSVQNCPFTEQQLKLLKIKPVIFRVDYDAHRYYLKSIVDNITKEQIQIVNQKIEKKIKKAEELNEKQIQEAKELFHKLCSDLKNVTIEYNTARIDRNYSYFMHPKSLTITVQHRKLQACAVFCGRASDFFRQFEALDVFFRTREQPLCHHTVRTKDIIAYYLTQHFINRYPNENIQASSFSYNKYKNTEKQLTTIFGPSFKDYMR